MSRHERATSVLLGVGILLALARPAIAFVTPCHQGITTDALDAGLWPLGAASPPLSHDFVLLENELSIDVAPRVDSYWSLGALLGNEYEDVGPYDAGDVIALAEYAARPENQPAHCLREPADDGSAGDGSALAACKADILDQLSTALGDGDTPDLTVSEPVRLHLVFRGDADIPLTRFSFHLGRATHALQDSFSHTFRSPDERQVRSVLNWVDWLKGSGGYVVARDGFHHIYALDQCDGATAGGLDRRAAAVQATSELIAAVADDEGGRAGRLARAAAVVDSWFGIGEICTADNHWCDAPEQNLTSVAGCALAPGRCRGGGVFVTLAVAALVARTRRKCRRRVARARTAPARAAAFLVGTLALTAGATAHAADARAPGGGDGPAEDGRAEVKGGLVAKAAPDEQRALVARRFGVLAGAGISIDNAGYQLILGVRYDLTRTITVGVSAEYSPWISIDTRRTTRGTTNAYAVGIYRWDVRDYLELRLTLAAGVSVLAFDTWAAQSGSVGPYFAISPLGVGIRMGGHLRLLIDPGELAVEIPQTTGIPFIYREHRFTVAVQANF
jgi:hypothetical protein